MSDMANTSGVHYSQQQQQQQQSHQPANAFQCKECGLLLNSAESLDVHLQYTHKEILLNKWSAQGAASMKAEENNNAKSSIIKREFTMNNTSSSDNSDSAVKSEQDFNRTSPEHVYGHPPTPQSNHSSSPYQSHENSAFSPHYQNYQQVKVEQLSPGQYYHYASYCHPNDQYYALSKQLEAQDQNQDQNLPYDQPFPIYPSSNSSSSHRYNPYQRAQQPGQISSVQHSSGHVYPPQPTPSPSPQTCDKCGYVCNSASQLVDHINMAHPPTPAPHLNSYQGNQHYLFGNDGQQMNTPIKVEEPSEILDLDSHQFLSKDDKRNNSHQNNQIPHNVSSLVGNWPTQQSNIQNQLQDRMNSDQMRFNHSNIIEQNKLPQPLLAQGQDFMSNSGTAPQRASPTSTYAGFDNLPSNLPTQSNNAVIPPPQVPNVPAPAPSGTTRSATWKSNEARRPKTYNCTACSKWFTSSGHLKRHYNTTLHKNAVKSSGQPDPASLPISTHHHPVRDNANSRDGSTSNSPNHGDSRLEDGGNIAPQYERPAPMPSHLQQPPNGPYDRQPQQSAPPMNTSLLQSPTLVSPMLSLNNLTNGNSPNLEAGPSTMNLESRGLLPLSTNSHSIPPGFSMAPHLMSMEANQFQMYPNEEAPHVTQDMAISSLSTTGEEFISSSFNRNSQILPSFDEIQSHRFAMRSYDDANVGGGVSATGPYVFLPDPYENTVAMSEDFNKENQFDNNGLVETNGNIYVYPADAVYVLPESQYLDMANNNNILDSAKWNNYLKNNEQDAFNVREEVSPDSTIQSPPEKEKPVGEFVCVECDKKFNKACYLTQHNKNTHSGEKPFKCTRCGKRYHDQSAYEIHVAKHGENKPHKCAQCKKMFNHKTDLRRHMFCHAGTKPHYCEHCTKGFIRKDHMLKHVETHKRREQNKQNAAANAVVTPKGKRR